jgi:hypothetical protein
VRVREVLLGAKVNATPLFSCKSFNYFFFENLSGLKREGCRNPQLKLPAQARLAVTATQQLGRRIRSLDKKK